MPSIILYGYAQEEASLLQENLETLLETDIEILSACGMENATVTEIISLRPNKIFFSHPFKVLVFIDFEDEAIQKTVYNFPAGVSRPIFCGLTPDNVKWRFGYLLEHLLEEYRLWQKRKQN
ncbi:MAG: DUF3783 domain-containing protein [Brevinematales bacterium]|nr:DUF3783 domain-containing protein [Brevinematales bacterium]